MLAELIMVGMLLSPTPEVECLAKNILAQYVRLLNKGQL